jgi:glyoxylase-like metal-dependent hydrolase (beta-lactamase superfamily II)
MTDPARFQIIPLLCGYVLNHERASFLYRTNCGGARLDAPCTAWLLRSDHQVILVDAGPGPRSRAPQHYTPGPGPDDLLLAALAHNGVPPEAIRTVVLTHLHNDHVGGAASLPNAVFHVQAAELREAVWPVPFQRPLYEINQPGQVPAWTAILNRMVVLEGDATIMRGLSTILLPGHTSGSQGVLVETASGTFLLPGDLVPLHDNWPGDGAAPIPNGNHTDLYAYDRSFRRLAGLNVTVLPSHDPVVFDRPAWP